MNVGLEHYLTVSALLFALGLTGVIIRRNILVIYMSLELMLNAANLAFVAMSRFTNNLDGQVMVFFIITVAAARRPRWRPSNCSGASSTWSGPSTTAA